MGTVHVEKCTYKNYGQCLKISNGICEAIVTIDIGPRIINFSFVGEANFLREDLSRSSVNDGEVIEAVFGKGSKFYQYGGHRLWMSPEDMPLTYYPDNDPVEYREIPGGAVFTPPEQRVNHLRLSLRVVMSEHSPELSVGHYATNMGSSIQEKALWSITQVRVGGLELVPLPYNDTGLLPNRVISIWPYDDLSDDRVHWGKRYVTLRQDSSVNSAFKFGINNNRGWAAYFINDGMFLKKYEHNPRGIYEDYGTSFETYTNSSILEMETLGERVRLTPGSTSFHGETWQLFKNVERPAADDESTFETLAKLYVEK